jgi:hypothetical protein
MLSVAREGGPDRNSVMHATVPRLGSGLFGKMAMRELKFALILLTAPLAALFALAQIRADYTLYAQLRDYGRPATAIVDSIEPDSFLGSANSGRKLVYVLELPGLAPIAGSAHMSKSKADKFSPGQEIEVVYAATAPAMTAPSVSHAWRALVSDLIVLGAYGAVLALTLVLARVQPVKSRKRLAATAGLR